MGSGVRLEPKRKLGGMDSLDAAMEFLDPASPEASVFL